MLVPTSVALVAVLAVTGCDKAGPKASGELSSAETSLLASMPRDADLAFGGNYLRLQKFLASSGFAKLMTAMENVAPGMTKWIDCFTELKDVKMVGTVSFAGGAAMRFAMTGITIDDVEKCAKVAAFPTKMDGDRKFLEIDTGVSKVGYLVLPSGALYNRQSLPNAMNRKAAAQAETSDRASYEADVAAAAKANATQNTKLQASIAKVDRSKAMWLAGNAANTPLGDKVNELSGSLDFGDGLQVDVVVEMKDAKLADEILSKFEDVKDMAGMLGPEVKELLDAVRLTKEGSRLHLVMTASTAQLNTLAAKIPMGALGRPSQPPLNE